MKGTPKTIEEAIENALDGLIDKEDQSILVVRIHRTMRDLIRNKLQPIYLKIDDDRVADALDKFLKDIEKIK